MRMDKYIYECQDISAKHYCISITHKKTDKIQNSPHPHSIPSYGAKIQYAEQLDDSPKLDNADTKYIQQVAGTLLYYGPAVDTTILSALSSIATEHAAPTERMMLKVKQLLDYCASQEEAIITYNTAKWSWQFTATRDMQTKKGQEAVRGDIFSYRAKAPTHQTIGQY